MIMICTMNNPKTVAVKSSHSILRDRISGTAKSPWRKTMEPREMKDDFFLEGPTIRGRISPINTKFSTLKIDPKINPLA